MTNKKKYTLDDMKELKLPYIKLSHEGQEDEFIVFDPLDRQFTWIDQAVLLPWSTPNRLFGWVHSAIDPRGGFVLHGAFTFHASTAIQPIDQNKARFIPGPKALLPYEFISQVDIDIHTSPMTLWLKKQGPEFREFMVELVKKHVFPPPMVEVAQPGDLAPVLGPLGPNGRKS